MSEEEKLSKFIDSHVKIIEPMSQKMYLAWWDSETTGDKKKYEEREKLEVEWKKLYSNKDDYKFLIGIDASKVKDPMLKRQLILLIDEYKSNQLPHDLIEEITRLETKVSYIFSTYRGEVNGKEVTDNQIRDVLAKSDNSEERKKHWEAQKAVGRKIEAMLKELVALRNKAASILGYKNYYQMMLDFSEMTEEWLIGLFDELDVLTKEPFKKVKEEIDAALKEKLKVDEVMPWHYRDPFFQECPNIFKVNLDTLFEDKVIEKVAEGYYKKVGLPVDSVLKMSDLYERKGKNQHAFCIGIDRKGDTRILMNIKNDAEDMSTMLHESGHAVYCINQDMETPYILRGDAHIFVTEAIAMLFGRLPHRGIWLRDMVEVKDYETYGEVGEKQLKFLELVMSRWIQVMVRFERELYTNPGQDLNKLWWELVEKYQMVEKPSGRDAPDYASKIHICTSPVYYHNYQLGELFASQLQAKIGADKLSEGSEDVGKFLTEKVFSMGAKLRWDKLVKYATGEELSPKAFAKEFV